MTNRKDCKEREEDRAFAELNKAYGTGKLDHLLIQEGLIIITCIDVIIGVIVWLVLF
jgi:hypothetical protein